MCSYKLKMTNLKYFKIISKSIFFLQRETKFKFWKEMPKLKKKNNNNNKRNTYRNWELHRIRTFCLHTPWVSSLNNVYIICNMSMWTSLFLVNWLCLIGKLFSQYQNHSSNHSLASMLLMRVGLKNFEVTFFYNL